MNNTINPALPIRNMNPADLGGFLFLNCPDDEGFAQFLTTMVTWIRCNWASDIRKEYERLMDTGKYNWTNEELDEIQNDASVISPVTLFSYGLYLERKRVGLDKMKRWEQERHIMDLYPGRFTAKYGINIGYANAKKGKAPEGIEDAGIKKFAEEEKHNKNAGDENRSGEGDVITFEEDIRMLLDKNVPNDECCEQMIIWHKM